MVHCSPDSDERPPMVFAGIMPSFSVVPQTKGLGPAPLVRRDRGSVGQRTDLTGSREASAVPRGSGRIDRALRVGRHAGVSAFAEFRHTESLAQQWHCSGNRQAPRPRDGAGDSKGDATHVAPSPLRGRGRCHSPGPPGHGNKARSRRAPRIARAPMGCSARAGGTALRASMGKRMQRA
jgi:hypothetical protein